MTAAMMTEYEWLNTADPRPMLQLMVNGIRGEYGLVRWKATERHFRLFMISCCRQIWPLLSHKTSRRAVEIAEEFLEGKATEQQLRLAVEQATNQWEELSNVQTVFPVTEARRAACAACWVAPCRDSTELEQCALHCQQYSSPRPFDPNANVKQADLLRDIVGNPFRPVIGTSSVFTAPTRFRFDPCMSKATLFQDHWRTPGVINLANLAYQDRDFTVMPILADALEDAGCDHEQILSHLRPACSFCSGTGTAFRVDALRPDRGGTLVLDNCQEATCMVCEGTRVCTTGHVRGCWVLDLLLGKE